MPPDRMIRAYCLCLRIEWSGHCFCPVCLFVCLSVCLSVVNFNLRYNIWTVRDRDFIFACILHLWCPFKWHQGQWPCDLTLTLKLKIAFSTLLPRGAYCSVSQSPPWFLYARLQTGRMMVWWCPSRSPSVRLSVCPFFALFSYMLWHIELKFCTWLCFNVLRIKFECRHFASIFEGVMPLCELRI